MGIKLGKLSVFSAFVFLAFMSGVESISPTLAQAPPAQLTPDERPKLKNFGASLKRLKWDKKQQAAVETKRKAKPNDAAEDDVVRVETNLVVCDVQVRDKRGQTVTDLTESDFIVTEDNQPQNIRHFSLGNDHRVGRTIVLLIDYSSSQAPYIKNSVAAAKILVDQLGPNDLMAIVTDDVRLLVDFIRDKAILKKKLDSLRERSADHVFGNSEQFSALMATVREMFTNEDIRPIVIFQTDGDELAYLRPSVPPIFSIPDLKSWRDGSITKKSFSLRDLYLAIEKSRVSVYAVIPGRRYIRASNQLELENLPAPEISEKKRNITVFQPDYLEWQQLAAAGAAIGGWTAYLQKPEDANEIYARILADMNSRYVIGYYPTNKVDDGKRRRVVVEIKGHPDYLVSGRKSYIAPDPEP